MTSTDVRPASSDQDPYLASLGDSRWPMRYASMLVGIDAAAIFLGLSAGFLLRFRFDNVGVVRGVSYAVVPAVLGPLWLASLAIHRAYEQKLMAAGSAEYRRVLLGSVRLFGYLAIGCYVARVPFARGYVAFAFPIGTALLLLGRAGCRQWLYRRRRSTGLWMHRVLAVGEADQVRELIDTVQRQPHASFAVVAACVPGGEVGHVAGVHTFSAMANIPAVATSTGVDTIAFTASRGMTSGTLRQLSWELEGTGIGIVVSPGLTDVAGPRISVRPVAGLPLLHVDEPDLGAARRVLKRGMDLALSCLLAVFLLPVLVAVALAVRLGSPGPVLFRQTRVGAGGKHFCLYKFRSMYEDAESRVSDLMAFNEASGPLFKMRNDPRVTPIGRVLRRYSLDELPQLINVFKGEMSLVGPRPPLPDEVSQYDEVMLRRLRVEPGVTGLWQVSGRSHLSWEDSVRIDLYYVENWSPLLDLSILARTVVAVLRPSGAY